MARLLTNVPNLVILQYFAIINLDHDLYQHLPVDMHVTELIRHNT